MPKVNVWIPILGVVAASLAVSVFPWAPSPVIHLALILLAVLVGAIFQGVAIPAAAFWRRFDLVHGSTSHADRKVTLKVPRGARSFISGRRRGDKNTPRGS